MPARGHSIAGNVAVHERAGNLTNERPGQGYTVMETARLYADTLRHLRPWQVAGRMLAGVRRGYVLSRPTAPAGVQGQLHPQTAFTPRDPWNTRADLLLGDFKFLNHTLSLGRPVDWEAASAPLLWRFNLHYFNYVHLLGEDEQATLCRDWIQANPVGRGVGWHPYPTSLRITNWTKAGMSGAEVQKSLYEQAAHLYRNLETYVYGNHLLENARALVLAGAYFGEQGEAPRWLATGLDLFRRETEEQILGDGAHFERSPMYHALMLEAYLDVLNVLPTAHPDRTGLDNTARRMGNALASFMHPDGRIALLNDATFEIAPPATTLLAYARSVLGYEPSAASHLQEAGYFVLAGQDLYLIVDGGAVGPDYLMAHAHADIFSFELSVAGERMVVDSGVYDYAAGPMRDYIRSTRAHNTVSLDGASQVECWGSFRVARRSAPRDVTFRREDGRSTFEGYFDGYAERIGDGIVHKRSIAVDEGRREIAVLDEIDGRGVHRVESRLHLHPDVQVTSGKQEWVMRKGPAECTLETDGAPLSWEEGWYCPQFGVRQRNGVAVMGGALPLPVRLSYRICY